MKEKYIYIAFGIVTVITAFLSIFYFLNLKEREISKMKISITEDKMFPKGVIKKYEEGNRKEIGGNIEEIFPDRIVISVDGNKENNIEIKITEFETVILKPSYHSNSLDYDLVSITTEELNTFRQKGTYVQSLVEEIIREDGETTYNAKTILYFPSK